MAAINHEIASRLEEVASILGEQGADRFRTQAYLRAASTLRGLNRSVAEIFTNEGLPGLENLPAVGPSIAHAIRDLLLHGRLAMLDRLRGEHDPITLLMTVPGVGKSLAWKLHDELAIDSLEELESAAHDGRLETLAGLGAKRLAGIRDSLAHRLGQVRRPAHESSVTDEPSVAELLEVDREYRDAASAGSLKKIAPRRFNPAGETWLPILHTSRGARQYTALFSNTARAHQLHKTADWVVLYHHGPGSEQQTTVITAEFGRLKGHRIVRGREPECEAHYKGLAANPVRASRSKS